MHETNVGQPESNDDSDGIDQAWLQRRTAAAPLIFGVVAIVTSVLMLGMLFGALGMRAGIDLWRAGNRRWSVILGVALSFVGVVVSVMCAVLWGSVLASVLLSRDVLRETERWRGQRIAAVECSMLSADGVRVSSLHPAPPMDRLVIVFVSSGINACGQALQDLAAVAPDHPTCSVLLVDRDNSAATTRAFALLHGADFPVLASETLLPEPLDSVAALPTLVVLNREGVVECAVVGAHPRSELHTILSGAQPVVATEPKETQGP